MSPEVRNEAQYGFQEKKIPGSEQGRAQPHYLSGGGDIGFTSPQSGPL